MGADPVGQAGARLPPVLGSFQLVGRMAGSRRAEVCLGRRLGPGSPRIAIVKRILPDLAADGALIDALLADLKRAQTLDHPGLCRVVESGRMGREVFVATEVVEGESLLQLVARAKNAKRPLSPALCAFVVAKAAAALQYAHGKGVVHGEPTLRNILVGFDGSVKVTDFGMGQALSDPARVINGKETFAYTSPEQAWGHPLDARADVFTLGISLCEAICGVPLFRRESAQAAKSAILSGVLPRPSRVVKISAPLEHVVRQALERDAEQRFASAEELRKAIDAAIRLEPASSTDLARAMADLFPGRRKRWDAAAKIVGTTTPAPTEDGEFDEAPATVIDDFSKIHAEEWAALQAAENAADDEGDAFEGAATVADDGALMALLAAETARRDTATPAPVTPRPSPPPAAVAPAPAIATAAPSGRPVSLTPTPIVEVSRMFPDRRKWVAVGGVAVAAIVIATFGLAGRTNEPTPTAATPVVTTAAAPATAPGAPPAPPAAPSPAPAPEPAPATLFLSTAPDGARVFVNGKLAADATPAVVRIPPGVVTLRLEKAGYAPRELEMILPAGEKVLNEKLVPQRGKKRAKAGGKAVRKVKRRGR